MKIVKITTLVFIWSICAFVWINYLPSPTRLLPSFEAYYSVYTLSKCDSAIKPLPSYTVFTDRMIVGLSGAEESALAIAASICKNRPSEKLPEEIISLANAISRIYWKKEAKKLKITNPSLFYTMDDVKRMLGAK